MHVKAFILVVEADTSKINYLLLPVAMGPCHRHKNMHKFAIRKGRRKLEAKARRQKHCTGGADEYPWSILAEITSVTEYKTIIWTIICYSEAIIASPKCLHIFKRVYLE